MVIDWRGELWRTRAVAYGGGEAHPQSQWRHDKIGLHDYGCGGIYRSYRWRRGLFFRPQDSAREAVRILRRLIRLARTANDQITGPYVKKRPHLRKQHSDNPQSEQRLRS